MTEKEVPLTKVVSIRKKVPIGQIGSTLSSLGISLMVFLTEQQKKPSGPGFTINHARTESEIDLEVCLPIADEIKIDHHPQIQYREVTGGKCLAESFKGSYEKLPEVHKRLSERSNSSLSREVFIKGPQQSKDANEWETEVQYFI